MPEAFSEFQLGKYHVTALLGRGGFGTVYRAVDTTLDRDVAIKVLHPQLTTDPDFVSRFRIEAKIIAGLPHLNIVGIYELGEENGRWYIVMEYLPGGTLRDRLAKGGAFSYDATTIVLREVSAGLDVAHTRGLVHRDMKPANILFASDGRAVVGDFGLARALDLSSNVGSSSGGNTGTPFYKAPELWRGKPPASPATDVYALGCVAYEMLTGNVLFSGDTPDEVITKHLVTGPDLSGNWPSAGAPLGLISVVGKALARDPKDRYPSALAFADSLARIATAKPPSTLSAAPAPLPAQMGADKRPPAQTTVPPLTPLPSAVAKPVTAPAPARAALSYAPEPIVAAAHVTAGQAANSGVLQVPKPLVKSAAQGPRLVTAAPTGKQRLDRPQRNAVIRKWIIASVLGEGAYFGITMIIVILAIIGSGTVFVLFLVLPLVASGGICVGLVQWLILRKVLPVSKWWCIAIAVAWSGCYLGALVAALGLLALGMPGGFAGGLIVGIAVGSIIGLAGGATVAWAQWSTLRRFENWPQHWTLASALGWAASWGLGLGLTLSLA